MRISQVAMATLCLCATIAPGYGVAQSKTSVSNRPKSKSRLEYERRKEQRDQERAAEKARLAKGPSKEEIRRAGHPLTAAKRFIAIARELKTPSQLRDLVSKHHWNPHEASVKRFDPKLARKELQKLGNRKDSRANLTRRINTHPDKKFVEHYRKIGKQVLEVTKAHWHPTQKFKAVITAKVVPDDVRDSWGNKAPTATIVFVLEDGKWRFEKYAFSIGITRSGGR